MGTSSTLTPLLGSIVLAALSISSVWATYPGSGPELSHAPPTIFPPPAFRWSLLNASGGPNATNVALYTIRMAYSPADRGILLYATNHIETQSYTWIYQNGTWTNLTSHLALSPPGRGGGGLVYDAADGYDLLFGGASSLGFYHDTWIFANDTWTQVLPSTSPPSLYRFDMTYDSVSARVVLYGGCCTGVVTGSGRSPFSNETWTYHNRTWTELPRAGVPPGQYDNSLGYDPTVQAVVAVGGFHFGARTLSSALNWTWELRNGSWGRINSYATTPGHIAQGILIYDGALNAFLLFGGYWGHRSLDITYLYRSGTWVNLTSQGLNPSPVCYVGSAAFDPVATELLVLDEQGRAWTLS